MNYIDDIFARADLQQITEFILHGAERIKPNSNSYYERIRAIDRLIRDELQNQITEKVQRAHMEEIILQALSAYESIYLEIGMQVGAKIALQCAENLERVDKGKSLPL